MLKVEKFLIGDFTMKRLLASVFAGVCILSAASCSSPMKSESSRENNLNSPFTAKMSVSLDKMIADGTITRHSDSSWVAEFDSPNTLSGVKLTFEDDAVEAIAKQAFERKTGARGLRSIMEKVMMDIMYQIPSDETIKECIITKGAVDGESEPLLIHHESMRKAR